MQNSENNQSKNQDIIDYEREDGEEGVENMENTLEKDVEVTIMRKYYLI